MTDSLTLRAGESAVQIDPACGARLVSWRVRDLELLGGRSGVPEEFGCYPMAPWAGRLRDNRLPTGHQMRATYGGWALHGTVLAQQWEVIEATESAALLRCALTEPWPWPGNVAIEWTLEPECLSARLEVTATGEPFPAVVGLHPWFRRRLERGDQAIWSLDAPTMLERGADHLPTGRLIQPAPTEGPFDDAFHVPDGVATIRWPGALRLTCRSDAQWYVVFDELPDVVCVEPQTGPPDGLTAAAPVTPAAPLTLSVTWDWSVEVG